MTDFFAVLDEPHRPWLDPVSLKAKFLARSAQIHPDRVHVTCEKEKTDATGRYAELNAAFNCLRNPKDRLAHLLQLERGGKPIELQQMPDALADRFMAIAQLLAQVDAFLAEQSQTAALILRVQMFERGQEWKEKLNAWQQTLATQVEKMAEQLKTLDGRWVASHADRAARREILEQLEKLYRLFSFYSRWNSQIQERLVRLTV